MFTFILVLLASFMRLIPHIPNFTPVTAIALFGGSYLNKKYSIFIPLLVIILSDYLLLYVNPYRYPFFHFERIYSPVDMIHSTTLYVWLSFCISGLVGLWLKNRKQIQYILGASFICSLQFFLITNYGVWASGYYPPGFNGLIQSYIMGLPFFRWTFLGDIFYGLLLFGLYELILWVIGNKEDIIPVE